MVTRREPQEKKVQGASLGRCEWLEFVLRFVMAVGLAGIQGRAQAPLAAGSGPQSRPSIVSEDNARIAAEAEEALRKGDYSKAIENLQKLERIAPGIAEIHANLATVYYSLGRFDDAAQQAQVALKLKPSLIQAHFFLGLSLAQSDRCKEALPYLEKDYPRAPDSQLKRALGSEALRCAMYANEPDRAVDLVRLLNRDFRDDPDLLYLSSHVYSDLSTEASQRLLTTAPESFQAHQLNAEVLEIQGKLNEAAEEYRKVLSLNPKLPGIHYQLGELLLAGDRGPTTLDEARRDFEEELKLHPRTAGAEYELGEMARQARQWDDAIEHFNRALTLDSQFGEALIGLGKSLVSAGRPQQAVAPLERAVRLEPGNAIAHYQLSFAYRRLGRDQEAAKELAAYREAHDRVRSSMQRIRTGILGNLAQPQTDAPPE
jgi:tetratricopeptide (TPR) repeat protein